MWASQTHRLLDFALAILAISRWFVMPFPNRTGKMNGRAQCVCRVVIALQGFCEGCTIGEAFEGLEPCQGRAFPGGRARHHTGTGVMADLA